MSDGRVSIDAKFARADEHYAELEAAVESWARLTPFRLVGIEEEPSGDFIWQVRIDHHPPRRLSMLIGDALHNARSALDHLARRLVECAGGTPTSSTAFPIADSAKAFDGLVGSRLAGARDEHVEAIRKLRPWQAGDLKLWQLHRLDIIDKHRLLIPAGAANHSVTVPFRMPVAPGSTRVGVPTLNLRVADPQYPLPDGAEVFRVMNAAREGVSEHQPVVNFELWLHADHVLPPSPLLSTVSDLIAHARDVAGTLAGSVA